MGLVDFLLLCIIVGLLIWAASYLPLPAEIHRVMVIAAVIVLVLILIRALFGGIDIPLRLT
jgi:hypothetical protein